MLSKVHQLMFVTDFKHQLALVTRTRLFYLNFIHIQNFVFDPHLGVIEWRTRGYMMAFSFPWKSAVYTLSSDINFQAMIKTGRSWVKVYELKDTLDTYKKTAKGTMGTNG